MLVTNASNAILELKTVMNAWRILIS